MSSPTTITLSLSDDDTRNIVDGVVKALTPIIEKQSAPLLVDADELARLLSLSRATIDRLRADGVITSIGEGRLRRYDPNVSIAELSSNGTEGNYHE